MNETEGFSKAKNKYLEATIIIFLLLFIPYILRKILLFFMSMYLSSNSALSQAEAFAYIITCTYDLIILWCGFLNDSFGVVKSRVKSFFSTLMYIKLLDSIKFSFQNIKTDGAFFWLYLGIIIFHFIKMFNTVKVFIH